MIGKHSKVDSNGRVLRAAPCRCPPPQLEGQVSGNIFPTLFFVPIKEVKGQLSIPQMLHYGQLWEADLKRETQADLERGAKGNPPYDENKPEISCRLRDGI